MNEFCRLRRLVLPEVNHPVRRCRIDHRSTSRTIEAETYGRKDSGDSGGQGWHLRALGTEMAEWPVALGNQAGTPGRTRSDPFDGVWEEEIEPLLRRGGGQAEGNDNYRMARGATSPGQRLPAAHPAAAITGLAGLERSGRRFTSPRSIHRAGKTVPWE